jgi:hypothetical protein
MLDEVALPLAAMWVAGGIPVGLLPQFGLVDVWTCLDAQACVTTPLFSTSIWQPGLGMWCAEGGFNGSDLDVVLIQVAWDCSR